MSTSMFLRIQRVVLSAGVKTPVYPPQACHNVSVGNATAGDLEVHTTDANNTEYLIVASGYERAMPTGIQILSSQVPAFWLKSAGGGTAVILWY